MQEAVVRTARLDLHPSWPAEELGRKVDSLLLRLADRFSIKEIVPGHIKALVSEGDQYAVFSCTRPGRVARKSSAQWAEAVFQHPQINLNVVLVNDSPVAEVEEQVDEIMAQLFPGSHFESHCCHDHQ